MDESPLFRDGVTIAIVGLAIVGALTVAKAISESVPPSLTQR